MKIKNIQTIYKWIQGAFPPKEIQHGRVAIGTTKLRFRSPIWEIQVQLGDNPRASIAHETSGSAVRLPIDPDTLKPSLNRLLRYSEKVRIDAGHIED